MNEDIEDIFLRRPTQEDMERVLELINSCDVNEYGEPDTDLEDLVHEWGQIDLETDAWLAYDLERNLVGYAAVLPYGDSLRYFFYSHPAWEGKELARSLLALCERRAPDLAAEKGMEGEVVARTFLTQVNERDHEIVEDAGFSRGRYYFEMRMLLEPDLPRASWPDQVYVRRFLPGQDEEPVYQLIEEAFYQPDRRPPTYEEWAALMLREEIFDPDLWFLAFHGDEIIGASLAFAYSSTGWVRQLGVAKDWQGKGVGRALLQHTFTEFAQMGYQEVGLSVESKRPEAIGFYQRVGMTPFRQYDEYYKKIVPRL